MPAPELADAGENLSSKTPDAFEGVARARAAMVYREAARLCETFPWAKGAAQRFMLKDELESVLQTNQGNFRIIIRRG